MKQSRQDFLKSCKTQRQLANSQSRIELAHIRKRPLNWLSGNMKFLFILSCVLFVFTILSLSGLNENPFFNAIMWGVMGVIVFIIILPGFINSAKHSKFFLIIGVVIALCLLGFFLSTALGASLATMSIISAVYMVARHIYSFESFFKDKQPNIVTAYEIHNGDVVIEFSANDIYALEDVELEIEDNKLIFHMPTGSKDYKISNLDEFDVENFVGVFDDLKGETKKPIYATYEASKNYAKYPNGQKQEVEQEDSLSMRKPDMSHPKALLGQNLASYQDEQYKEDEWEETDEEEYEEEEESKYSQSKETQNDTQSYQNTRIYAESMAHYNQQFQHTLSQQGKLDKYNEASLRYAHKERDNAFMEVFKLSTEEFEKLTPKDFEDFQGLLDARIIECVEALRFESLSFEVNLTQAFAKNISSIPRCEVELFVPLSNEENQHTIGFNTKDFAKKPSIKPNRTFFFDLLKAGANIDMGLVEQVQNLFIAYRSAHSERIDYYNSDNEEWERRYYDSQAEEEYLDSHPVVKILQEMMLALQACLYAPKLSRTEVLNELDKEVRLSSWNMPQVAEYFIYNQGESIGYKRQQLEKKCSIC